MNDTLHTEIEEALAKGHVVALQHEISRLRAGNALLSITTLLVLLCSPAVIIVAYTFALEYLTR